MDTAAINYRVADFLKDYPPFQVMDVEDLLRFALHGRVRFYEPNQFVVTQGASRFEVFVIQQGTVLLWDEQRSDSRLLDVRGAGAMLGIDEFHRRRTYPYSARSATDVLVYSFPAEEFAALIEKYPDAVQYIAACSGVTADYRSRDQIAPQTVSLRTIRATTHVPQCDPEISIRAAAQLLMSSNADLLFVRGSNPGTGTLFTANSFVEWAANGGSDTARPVHEILNPAYPAIRGDASVAEAELAMASHNARTLTTTSDGTVQGQVLSILTARDLQRSFGDRPLDILQDIRRTTSIDGLRDARERSRSFVLQYLTDASASEWLSAFTTLVDENIIRRIVAMEARQTTSSCWCFCGPAGRAESLTSLAPEIVVLLAEDGGGELEQEDASRRVRQRIEECGYLTDRDVSVVFNVAATSAWKQRFLDWIHDPIANEIYLARPFFDLKPIVGNAALCRDLETQTMAAIDHDFLYIAANDCLGNLPPLTFFQNAVVDDSGEETSLFRLEETVLLPLVDTARVFGLAAKKVFGTSTLERFAMAGRLLPERANIFQEAAETFRIVLWQQGRTGIAQRSSGKELSPNLLNAYDRQILRNAFRSILRLLESIGDLEWLKRL